MAVITIGGLAGSGARTLGPMVAQRLGYDYVDRLVLTDAARHIGATVEALHQREERPPSRAEQFSRFLQRVLERSAVSGAGGDPYFGPGVAAFLTQEYEELPQPIVTRGHELEDEEYFEAIRRVMRSLAARDNVVIIGRGGTVILKDIPGVLRVNTVARLEDRIARVMERERLSRAEAEKVVAARDKARAYYFKRFFKISDSEHPENYHLVINTSAVSFSYATEMIVDAVKALEEGRLYRERIGAAM